MRNNYVFFAKEFLTYKLHTLDKSKVKDDFDVIALEQELTSDKVKTIDDIHTKCNLIATKGLKQISTLSHAIKHFDKYLTKYKYAFETVDTNLIDDYTNKYCIDEKISYGVRTNYKNTITAFCTYIDNQLKFSKKFKIEKIKVISSNESSKPKDELTDWLDTPSIIKVNKSILGYSFSSDFEKNRDILIFRLFLFSGILPNEMASLTFDSFIFQDGYMALKIDGIGSKEREIPLPKDKLIRYYNQYIELRDKKAKTFFYSVNDSKKKIDTKILGLIVKKLLDFSKIDVRDKTPKMLRKSYAIFLNNEKDKETGFTQSEKNIQYLLGIKNISHLRELLKYHSIELMTASKAFEGLDI